MATSRGREVRTETGFDIEGLSVLIYSPFLKGREGISKEKGKMRAAVTDKGNRHKQRG